MPFLRNKSRRMFRHGLSLEGLESRHLLATDVLDAAVADPAAIEPAAFEGAAHSWDLGDLGARFFISTKGLGESPAPENPLIRLQPGETTQLHIWAQLAPRKHFTSVALDVVAMTPGIAHATAVTVLNPLLDGESPRWQPSNVNPLGYAASYDAIGQWFTNLSALSVTARGLRNDGLSQFDETYDAETGTLLHATIEVVADRPGATEIFLGTGRTKTVSYPQDVTIGLGYGFDDEAVSGVSVGRLSRLADATIIVDGHADGPPGTVDSYQVGESQTLEVGAAAGVLANDGPSNGSLEARLIAGPLHGTVTLRPDGGFTYTPEPNAWGSYVGLDRFSYVSVSGDMESLPTAVLIDVVPLLRVTDDVVVQETDSGIWYVEFQIGLSDTPVLDITVDFVTVDGSATAADGDYTPVSGTLTFTSRSGWHRVRVPVHGDRFVEGDETFSLRLSNPANAVLDRPRAKPRLATMTCLSR